MNYYLIDNAPYESELDLTQHGHASAYKLTKTKYLFALANPSASIDEKKAGKLNEPTAEQLLESAKANKIAELETAYNTWQSAGWTDTVTGLVLFISDKDKINYTQLKSLAESNIVKPIGTTTGWHDLDKTSLLRILNSYGNDCFEAYKHLSDLKIYVTYVAQTIAEVEAITW